MFTLPAGLYGLGSPLVDSADFDGANDWIARGADLIGAVDSKQGVFSAWVRIDGGDGATRGILSNTSSRVTITKNASQVLSFVARNSGGSIIMDFSTASTIYGAGPTWRHILASWDLAAGAKHLYMNDISDLTVSTFINDTIDYTTGDWAVGAANSSGFLRFDGCFAELYFKMGVYLDFSVVANRRRFIAANLRPAILGPLGTLPGLGLPDIYMRLRDGEAPANFAINRGGGGDFTISGALTTGSTSPSD